MISIRKYWFVFVAVFVLAFLLVPMVYAQGENPPPVEVIPTTIDASLIAFVVLITGFFKQQFNLQGKWILVTGFVITLVLGFLPDLQALVPGASEYIGKFFLILKVFMASAGAFDTVVNAGAKIATATITGRNNKLNTDGSDILPGK